MNGIWKHIIGQAYVKEIKRKKMNCISQNAPNKNKIQGQTSHFDTRYKKMRHYRFSTKVYNTSCRVALATTTQEEGTRTLS